MKYERLTKWEDERTASINGSSPIDKDFENAINRLAELEDKIEDGRIIVLERKIGDYVFCIDTLCLNFGVPNLAIKEGEIVKIQAEIQKENIKYRYTVECFDHIFKENDTKSHYVCAEELVFTTKEDAEAKLKELRGE